MDEENSGKVYFICNVCGYIFLEDPYKMPIVCPQCGSENVSRT